MDKIEAGKIVNTHGVRGDVKIEVWLDSPEFLKTFKRVFIGDREYKFSGSTIAHLGGVDDMNAAMALKGSVISVAREDAHLPEGTYFIQEILGSTVVDEDGNVLGTLDDVMENPASPIYVIGSRLIPAVPEFIKAVDPEKKLITVHLIEGL